ncbi:glycosyltransferase [Salinicoccus roseus]|uniref:Glycosyl transferase family 1 domain-containing protein n=1 Tax=Salinicoccus roseus TaxID=45670 RepID=A0A265E603_9STAP|nr:glycosyltransferase [Salinicoccus roseus]OZT76866.1 hypothetical protein CFN03_07240 [Salinicoccus roseus]
MNDIEFLFLGGLFPKELEEEIQENSRGNIQNAANSLQWNFLNGLEDNLPGKITILNSMYIGSFPKKYKKIYIKTHDYSRTAKTKTFINVGFLNIPIIKHYDRARTLKPYIKKWIEKNKHKNKVIIAYAMTPVFTELIKYAKLMDEHIFSCLIVPDLPQYMNVDEKQSLAYSLLKKGSISKINDDMKYIDSYVFLTEHMADYLNITHNYTIIEGIATNHHKDIQSDFPEKNNSKFKIFYSGGLQRAYGIVELVESFRNIKNDNLELIICGSGEAEEYILNESKNDKRIKFLGLLERKDVLELQMKSDLLVNPRNNVGKFTKYSFPSKIIEYMCSGTPVLAYKLDGMPKEYYNYLYTINEEENLEVKLREIIKKTRTELSLKGNLASEFIMTNKNSKAQVKKLIDLIYGNLEKL